MVTKPRNGGACEVASSVTPWRTLHAQTLAAWAFVPALVIVTVFAPPRKGLRASPNHCRQGSPRWRRHPRPAPPPDAASVARGTALYETRLSCAPCHGLTGRGGPNNSPDLTRSALAMQPDGGQRLSAFLRVGRPDKGMPPVPAPLTEQEAADLSAKLGSLGFAAAPAAATGRGAGRPRRPSAASSPRRSTAVDSRRRPEAREAVLRGGGRKVLDLPYGEGWREQPGGQSRAHRRRSTPTRKPCRTPCSSIVASTGHRAPTKT